MGEPAVLSYASGGILPHHGPLSLESSAEDRVREIGAYFDDMLDLIPAQYYIRDETADDSTWSRYMRVRVTQCIVYFIVEMDMIDTGSLGAGSARPQWLVSGTCRRGCPLSDRISAVRCQSKK